MWDPHPRYVIDAFGRKLFLELEQNDEVLAKDLHVSDRSHAKSEIVKVYVFADNARRR